MGCEQLVQHAKVSKNRKFIPHFRENLARPLDKGGVGVVYLPCNPQSAASVREVINTANRLIHRVTAEVINPFQQLSTLYRHVVDTSPPPRAHRRSGLQPRRSIVPSVHSRTATRFTAEPQHCRPVSRCTAHRSTVLFASLRRFPAVPQHCRPAFRCTASLLHRSISVFFPLYRGTALPLLRFISVQRHCSTGLPFAALPLRRFAGFGPFCSKTLSCSLFFPFPGCLSPPFPGCLSARRRLRPATRRPRQRSPRRGGSSPLRTRNPVPHLGSGDSTPGGRIAAPAAQLHRNAGWRGGASEG